MEAPHSRSRAAGGGDDDDFEFMLGDMPDYRPAEEPEESGQEGDVTDLLVTTGEGGEPAAGLDTSAEVREAQEGGQPPKKKKRRQKKVGLPFPVAKLPLAGSHYQ